MDVKVNQLTAVSADMWVREDPQWKPQTIIAPVEASKETSQSAMRRPDEEASNSGMNLVNLKDVQNVVEDVQQYLLQHSIRLSFEIRDKTGDLVVRVLDKDTGEIIRQIPPEEMLRLREKLEELTGVLLNGKV
ncbi:flagellar protein FlaG [Desulfosoma caldarium]|uniref:FlaG protein n=1 Tax=Desulfosoma caldarium TaxID=610254 RepID=A0A3N1VGD6_9BACT|nr:flagellar protein FlaG [Desulfosoma caldarium]ROR01923.1 FlaG protein [Desulfosoma caldarium]